MHRSTFLTVAVVLVVAIVPGCSDDDSGAGDGTVAGGRDVEFTVMWEYSDIVTDCADVDEDVCLNHFAIPALASFTGDVSGFGTQVVLWNEPTEYPDQAVDHIEHVATYNVDATLDECGGGRFMVVETIQFVSGDDLDRDTGTYEGTWQIVAESGRNGLSSVAGRGTSSGVFGTASEEGRTFTGSVSCE